MTGEVVVYAGRDVACRLPFQKADITTATVSVELVCTAVDL